MLKVKTNRVKYPEGWELIEPTLHELQEKMREAIPGYERLCWLRCMQPRDHNFATTCVCHVPKHLREEKVIECVHCGCKGRVNIVIDLDWELSLMTDSIYMSLGEIPVTWKMNGLNRMNQGFTSLLEHFQAALESLDVSDSAGCSIFLAIKLALNNSIPLQDLVWFQWGVNSFPSAYGVAEKGLEKCMQGCGGKQTEPGYKNNSIACHLHMLGPMACTSVGC
ncbi:Protein BUD31-like protein 2 [Hibiscus syriacus]|uniref:Protein BUD31-like protein 2 n=1 Tax=Hibiscus syriacus TaxID=106335 RepID=A0A6A2YMX0_HIBSY|nr:Protein BUD31-like protein 2 [Hibiscus syriacus]